MKKLFLIAAVAGSALLFSSCSKESQSDMVLAPTTTIVNATVSANNTYELVLDKLQNVTITKQAAHSKSSVVEMDLKSGSMIYRYTPAMNFKGADEVVLTSKTAYTTTSAGSGGNCGGNHGNNGNGHESGGSGSVSYTSTSMTIKINVTE